MEVLYNGRHVTGSPFHQEIFDPRKVKLESAKKSGFVGDEMSLDSMYIGIFFRSTDSCRQGTRTNIMLLLLVYFSVFLVSLITFSYVACGRLCWRPASITVRAACRITARKSTN